MPAADSASAGRTRDAERLGRTRSGASQANWASRVDRPEAHQLDVHRRNVTQGARVPDSALRQTGEGRSHKSMIECTVY
jgi:hypothetical protein